MKLSQDDLQRIVEQQMPKYKLCDQPASPAGAPDANATADSGGSATRATPEAQTPDVKTLRKKYLRDKFLSDTGTRGGDDDQNTSNGPLATDAIVPDAGGDDTQIILVEPKTKPHPLDRGSRPKAVVVSATQKKIIGTQG